MTVSVVYRRHEPEKTVLYQVLAKGIPALLKQVAERGQALPAFVESELLSYLDCGILERGFVRVRCPGCGFDRLVAFSCQGRGFCPSCCCRRMADEAARWVDGLLPAVPYRQWVLSLPPPLRYLLAYDAELLRVVIKAFIRAIDNHLRFEAKTRYGLERKADASSGAITVVQRFGSALNLNVHLHVLAPDGVFVARRDGLGLEFLHLGRPTHKELDAIAWETCIKVIGHLRRQGRWTDLGEEHGGFLDGEDVLAVEHPVLSDIYGASIRGVLAFGSRSGGRVLTFVSHPCPDGAKRPCGVMGFDVDAGVSVTRGERKKLERLCRYLLRPPASTQRFEALDDGRVAVRLKRPYSDGTTHIVLTPIELAEKLAALVPPPRVNQIRYHGVFAPRSKNRSKVLAMVPESEVTKAKGEALPGHSSCANPPQGCGPRHSFAALLARVFAVDVLECPKCKSRMQRIATITEPHVIRRILDSVRRAADSPAQTAA